MIHFLQLFKKKIHESMFIRYFFLFLHMEYAGIILQGKTWCTLYKAKALSETSMEYGYYLPLAALLLLNFVS